MTEHHVLYIYRYIDIIIDIMIIVIIVTFPVHQDFNEPAKDGKNIWNMGR